MGVGLDCDSPLDQPPGPVRVYAPSASPLSRGRRGGKPEGPPVVAIEVEGDQVPPTSGVNQAQGLGVPLRHLPVCVYVSKNAPLLGACRRGSHGKGPMVDGEWRWSRWTPWLRRCPPAGCGVSGAGRARASTGQIKRRLPDRRPPSVATRRPKATASASSSSRSKEGACPRPRADTPAGAGHGLHRVPEAPRRVMSSHRPRGHSETARQLLSGPVDTSLEQCEELEQTFGAVHDPRFSGLMRTGPVRIMS